MGHCLYGRHPDLFEDQRKIGRNDQKSTSTTLRKQPLPQTRQMRILQNSNRIPWTYHQRRQNDDGPQQTKRDQRLANSENYQTSQILAWIWKLLLTIHQGILPPGTTAQSTPQKRSTFHLGRQCTNII